MKPVTLMIVDDEISSREYICNIIARRCPGIAVISMAQNGRDALEILNSINPDIIITDMRMPVMDGVEFAEELNKRRYGGTILVLSGYQEFEYARSAFRNGVEDYLLKPIEQKSFIKTLEEIRKKIEEGNRSEECRLIRALSRDPQSPWSGKSEWKSETFNLAILHWGGPVFTAVIPPDREYCEYRDGFWIIDGRNEGEFCYFSLSREKNFTEMEEFVYADIKKKHSTYYTVYIHREHFGPDSLYRQLKSGLDKIDRRITLNEPVIVSPSGQEDLSLYWNDEMKASLKDVLLNARYQKLDEILNDWVSDFGKNKLPLHSIALVLFRVLQYIGEHGPNASAADFPDINRSVWNMLIQSSSYGDLKAELWKLVRYHSGIGEQEYIRDIPVFFRDISHYVEEHFTEKLNLGDLSDHFGLSHSYLGKLFKKYHNCSYSLFLARTRVGFAQKIMISQPQLSIQSISAICGFEDQYYFSRVFKKVTGETPSAYRKGKDL